MYTITNIKAVYTNRIPDQCYNSIVQSSQIACFNNVNALLNERCLGQFLCVVQVNSTLDASEAATRRVLLKKVFLKILQNSQEKPVPDSETPVPDSLFLIKL